MDPNQPHGQYPQDHTPAPGSYPPGPLADLPKHKSEQYASYWATFFIYYAVGRVSPSEFTGTSRSDIFALCHMPGVICRGCNYLIARAEGGSKDKKQDIICRGILLTAARTLIFSLIVIAQLHCTIYR